MQTEENAHTSGQWSRERSDWLWKMWGRLYRGGELGPWKTNTRQYGQGSGGGMPGLRNSLPKSRCCKAKCVQGLVGIYQGMTKDLWGGWWGMHLQGHWRRQWTGRFNLGDKMVPLNVDFHELYKIQHSCLGFPWTEDFKCFWRKLISQLNIHVLGLDLPLVAALVIPIPTLNWPFWLTGLCVRIRKQMSAVCYPQTC